MLKNSTKNKIKSMISFFALGALALWMMRSNYVLFEVVGVGIVSILSFVLFLFIRGEALIIHEKMPMVDEKTVLFPEFATRNWDMNENENQTNGDSE